MNRLNLGVLSIFFALNAFSQTANDRPKDIKDSPLIKMRMAQTQTRTSFDGKVSEYYGLESNILAILASPAIPANFPKSITYANKSKYIEDINLWLKQNPSLVKPEQKNTLITE